MDSKPETDQNGAESEEGSPSETLISHGPSDGLEPAERTPPEDGDSVASAEPADSESGTDPDDSVVEEGSGSDDGPSAAAAMVGEILADRYRLDELIGGGGMGDVYRAEHVMMKKTVAVKVLRPDIAHQENVVERFRREAQAAGNIDHPNVCAATDFGRTENDSFYLVMEFVEGRTLKDVIEKDGELSVDRTIYIADEIASALERAHELGVVHRDLKPENVMLVEREKRAEAVKVLDFGVSRVQMADDMPSITKTGAVFGTPHYMSPEQASGEEIDHRADLYGLGGIIYEMLTGGPVFEGNQSVHVMAAHLKDEPRPLSEASDRDDVPRPLERLVFDLLEKDPADRPQSATDVRGRLETTRQISGTPDLDPDDTHTIQIQVPTGQWFKQAGTASIDVLREQESKLPFDIDLGNFSRSTVIAVGVIVVACSALAAVAGLYLATTFLAPDTPAERHSDLASQRKAYVSRPKVKSALQLAKTDSPDKAAAKLEELGKDESPNPHLEFLLGEVNAQAEKWKASLEHYEKAVTLEPSYMLDDTLIDDVVFAFGASDSDVSESAAEILAEHASRPPIREKLGDLAWESDSAGTRKRAMKVLEKHELVGKLPEWQRLSIKLRRAHGCAEHEKYIAELAELGNPEGLGILKLYSDMPKDGCGAFNNKDCYGCIRKELSEAIEEIENGGDGAEQEKATKNEKGKESNK